MFSHPFLGCCDVWLEDAIWFNGSIVEEPVGGNGVTPAVAGRVDTRLG